MKHLLFVLLTVAKFHWSCQDVDLTEEARNVKWFALALEQPGTSHCEYQRLFFVRCSLLAERLSVMLRYCHLWLCFPTDSVQRDLTLNPAVGSLLGLRRQNMDVAG